MDEQLDTQLARRLQQALTVDNDGIFQLLNAPESEVLAALLRNPHLNEDHLLILLKRRDLSESLIKKIYQRSRESHSHRLILALVKNPVTPGAIVRNLLPQLRLFELVDICFLPGVTPDQRFAAERAILQRLPTTPLGNKITLARRATSPVVAAILMEGDAPTVDPCLSSPRLKEAAVYQFLNSARANAETISQVARHSRWQQRPNIRLAILKNRLTPPIWYTLWLPRLNASMLRQLLSSRRLNPAQKKLVEAELNKRGNLRPRR